MVADGVAVASVPSLVEQWSICSGGQDQSYAYLSVSYLLSAARSQQEAPDGDETYLSSFTRLVGGKGLVPKNEEQNARSVLTQDLSDRGRIQSLTNWSSRVPFCTHSLSKLE